LSKGNDSLIDCGAEQSLMKASFDSVI